MTAKYSKRFSIKSPNGNRALLECMRHIKDEKGGALRATLEKELGILLNNNFTPHNNTDSTFWYYDATCSNKIQVGKVMMDLSKKHTKLRPISCNDIVVAVADIYARMPLKDSNPARTEFSMFSTKKQEEKNGLKYLTHTATRAVAHSHSFRRAS